MSPNVKKFITLAITGVATALVTSGILPASITDAISPHMDAIAALIVGLVLPEVGKAAPAVEVKAAEEDEHTQPRIAVTATKRSGRS